jgi:hypothetical protein
VIELTVASEFYGSAAGHYSATETHCQWDRR